MTGPTPTRAIFEKVLLPEGWARDVEIAFMPDGRILSVGEPSGQVAQRISGVAVPGLADLHSHAFQRGMAGLTEVAGPAGPGTDSFWTWRDLMYRFLDRLDPETTGAIAAMAYVEMVKAGFTAVGEFHYLHNDPAGRPYAEPAEIALHVEHAATTAGLALCLLPVFYAHADFGAAAPLPAQRRFTSDVDAYARLVENLRGRFAGRPDRVVGIAPHSLRAATPAELVALRPLMADAPVHIHVAEQRREVEACLAALGAPPVAWLLGTQPVDARWCLVHATHMTAQETTSLARSGAVAGLCPITEANLGDGVFDARRYRDAAGRFGIGSDSNVRIDAAEELRLLEYGQRLTRGGRCVLAEAGQSNGAALFGAALAGGAQAAGFGRAAIAPGCRADIVVLDDGHPALCAHQGDAVLDAWIFGAGREAVRDVWCGGRRMVADRRHIAEDAVVRGYRAAMKRLLS